MVDYAAIEFVDYTTTDDFFGEVVGRLDTTGLTEEQVAWYVEEFQKTHGEHIDYRLVYHVAGLA